MKFESWVLMESLVSGESNSMSRKQSERLAESGSSGEDQSDDEDDEDKVTTQVFPNIFNLFILLVSLWFKVTREFADV